MSSLRQAVNEILAALPLAHRNLEPELHHQGIMYSAGRRQEAADQAGRIQRQELRRVVAQRTSPAVALLIDAHSGASFARSGVICYGSRRIRGWVHYPRLYGVSRSCSFECPEAGFDGCSHPSCGAARIRPEVCLLSFPTSIAKTSGVAACFRPRGSIDNSPAIYRWDAWATIARSPGTIGPRSAVSTVPPGLATFYEIPYPATTMQAWCPR